MGYVKAIAQLSQLIHLPLDLHLQAHSKLGEEILKYFEKTSLCFITNECLVVNTLRRMGRYEEANHRFAQLKLAIKTGRHPVYYRWLKLDKF